MGYGTKDWQISARLRERERNRQTEREEGERERAAYCFHTTSKDKSASD